MSLRRSVLCFRARPARFGSGTWRSSGTGRKAWFGGEAGGRRATIDESGEPQFTTGDDRFAERGQDFWGERRGQVDRAELIEDADLSDQLAADLGFVGNRSNDVARLHLVSPANFEPLGFHLRIVSARTKGGATGSLPRRFASPRFSIATWFPWHLVAPCLAS